MQRLKLAFSILLLINVTFGSPIEMSDERLQLDFWLRNHVQVTDLPECKDAQEIFDNLLKVADKPADVLPRLYVFSDLTFGQVFALPDGSIILPLRVIKFCFRNQAYGKARLAFVLGHELKHIVHRDYWTIEQLLSFAPDTSNSLSSLKVRAAFESKADEYGILYAALAGFDVRAIIGHGNNFIPDYIENAGIKLHNELTNSSPEERLKVVQRRLGDILTHLDLFDFGVRLYAIGRYDPAIELFEKFVIQFPSREVFNNLGLCYYQKAMAHYAEWKRHDFDTDPHLIFRVSAKIDPLLRLRTKSIEEPAFQEMIDKALANFEEAKNSDATYAIARNNLGCAHLLKGETDFAKGNFKKALELQPDCKEALNNLGVAGILEGNAAAAERDFKGALKFEPDYPEPIFNLGRLYQQIGRTGEAATCFKRYLQVDSTSWHANVVRQLLGKAVISSQPPDFVERIDGKTPSDDTPPNHGYSNQFTAASEEIAIFHDDKNAVSLYRYISTSSYEKNFLRRVCPGNRHRSTKGITIGAPESAVREKYPYPCTVKDTSSGGFRIYGDLSLVFEMRNGRVQAWYLYGNK